MKSKFLACLQLFGCGVILLSSFQVLASSFPVLPKVLYLHGISRCLLDGVDGAKVLEYAAKWILLVSDRIYMEYCSWQISVCPTKFQTAVTVVYCHRE